MRILGEYLINLFRIVFAERYLISVMTKSAVADQYVGSFLGFLWNFINPLARIFIFWLVFSLGFKVQPKNDVPFVVWLTAGMAAWFVFSEIISSTSSAIVSNSHLIKKVLFPVQILPIVQIIACLVSHLVFMLILLGLIGLMGMPVNYYFLQFFYYLFCLSILVLGLSFLVSALNVFIRDVGQGVGVILQIGFWATPVFWDIGMMPQKIQAILKLNPMFYIVQGYRDSFIYFVPFWSRPDEMMVFWGMTLILLLTGIAVFMKLQPQFADVL